MSKIMNTPLSYSIWKVDLPDVETDKKGRPFVHIPDPDNPGETIHFISLPGDGPEELFTLAAAYLALAQHAGQVPVDAGATIVEENFWDDRTTTERDG